MHAQSPAAIQFLLKFLKTKYINRINIGNIICMQNNYAVLSLESLILNLGISVTTAHLQITATCMKVYLFLLLYNLIQASFINVYGPEESHCKKDVESR